MTGQGEVLLLLQTQAADLSRFRLLIEAQSAVLLMEDVSLLEPLGREADQLVVEISRREDELSRWKDASGALPAPAALRELVRSSTEQARLAASRLAARMRTLHLAQARELAAVDLEWNRLGSGYAARPGSHAAPVLLDRTG